MRVALCVIVLLVSAAQADAAGYAALVQSLNPIAYWRLDEAGGATAADSVGGFNGTYNSIGGANYAQPGALVGDLSTAVRFTSAQTAYVEGAINPALMNGNWTVTGWFNRSSQTQWGTIFSNNGATFTGPNLEFIDNTNQLGGHGVGVTPNNVSVNFGANNHFGEWIFGAITKTGGNASTTSTLTAYAFPTDGSSPLVNSGTNNGWFWTPQNTFEIGRLYTGGFYFNGLIDEVAVFNSALSQSQLQQMFNVARGFENYTPPVTPEPSSFVLCGTVVLGFVLSFGEGIEPPLFDPCVLPPFRTVSEAGHVRGLSRRCGSSRRCGCSFAMRFSPSSTGYASRWFLGLLIAAGVGLVAVGLWGWGADSIASLAGNESLVGDLRAVAHAPRSTLAELPAVLSDRSGEASPRSLPAARGNLRDLAADGLQQLLSGNEAAATSLFQQALQGEPNNVAAMNGMGAIRELQGRVHDALAYYEAAHRTQPKDAETANNLAWLLATQVDDTIRDSRRSLALALLAVRASDRKNPAYLDTLAAAYAANQDFATAISVAQEGRKLALAADNRSLVADFDDRLAAYSSHRTVVAGYGRMTVRQPSSLAKLVSTPVTIDRFLEDLRRGLQRDPHQTELAAALARVLSSHDDPRARDPELALQIAELVCTATHQKYPEGLEALAAAQAARNDFPEAIRTLKKSILQSEVQRPGADLSRLERRLGIYALQQLDCDSFSAPADTFDEGDLSTDLAKGWCSNREGKLAHAHWLLGRQLQAAGERQGAILLYRQAIGLSSRVPLPFLTLGKLSLDSGRIASAAEYLEFAFQFAPDDPRLCNTLGTVRELQNRPHEAIAHFQHAAELRPQWPEPVNNLAWLLATSERSDIRDGQKAVEKVEPLCVGREPNARYLDTYAAALASLGKFDEAVRMQRLALRHLGGKLDAALAEGMERRRRLYELRRPYEGEQRALIDLGNAALVNHNLAEADRFLQAALDIRLEEPRALNLMGAVRELQGRLQGAIGYYALAMKFQPNDPQIANNIAWAMSAYDVSDLPRSNEAINFAKRACELAGRDQPAYLDTLATAYANVGQFDNATRTAEQAVAVARGGGFFELAEQIESRLALYRAGKRYRSSMPVRPSDKP